MGTIAFRQNYSAEIVDELFGNERIRCFPENERGGSLLIVRFVTANGAPWVGGFRGGTLSARPCTAVFASPCSSRAVVASCGRVYAVPVEQPEETTIVLPELITQVVPIVDAEILLLADPWELHAYGKDGLKWSTGRLSMEGLVIIGGDARKVIVRVEDPDGEFEELSIDVSTGRATFKFPSARHLW